MSGPRATDRTSRLDRSLKTHVLFLACVVGLSGCPQLLCDIGIADQCETYTVTYSANGADSGTVPVDGDEYQAGDEVVVRSNTGGLGRAGYSFVGWNTAPNDDGTSYSSGDSFRMEFVDVTLYAEWEEENDEDEDSDAAGITVDPTSGLVTTEAGGNATFTVVLNTQPVADVTIGLSSSDTGEGTVSPNSLTFTSGNWSSVQTVTVT